jgi:hypothetical protein
LTLGDWREKHARAVVVALTHSMLSAAGGAAQTRGASRCFEIAIRARDRADAEPTSQVSLQSIDAPLILGVI